MPKGTFKPYLLCELFAHEKAGFPQINEESPPFFVYRIKSRFSVKRRNPNPSPTWKIKFGFLSFGPSDRIRTCGILLPKQARYQLRYTRLLSCFIRLGVSSQPPSDISTSAARHCLPHNTAIFCIFRDVKELSGLSYSAKSNDASQIYSIHNCDQNVDGKTSLCKTKVLYLIRKVLSIVISLHVSAEIA